MKIFLIICAILNIISCAQLSPFLPAQNYTDKRYYDKGIVTNVRRMIRDQGLDRKNHVVIDSFHATLLISGEVANEEQKQRIEYIANNPQQARRVYNRLAIMPPSMMAARIGDLIVNSDVRSALIKDKRISIKQIKPITTNGVVYLMGIGSKEQDALAVILTSRVRGVRKIVRLIEIM